MTRKEDEQIECGKEYNPSGFAAFVLIVGPVVSIAVLYGLASLIKWLINHGS